MSWLHGAGLVVVDPVRAFTDPSGLIGRLHESHEFDPIEETVRRLASFVAAHDGPKVWVRPCYRPGQFSGGDLRAPLAHLCVDPDGPDCEWDPRLAPPADALVVTKTTVDAGSSPEYVQATEAMVGHVDALLVAGFWLTTCVAATALSSAQRLRSRLAVTVRLPLTASRAGLYDPDDPHPAEVDVARQLARLRAAGVLVSDSIDE